MIIYIQIKSEKLVFKGTKVFLLLIICEKRKRTWHFQSVNSKDTLEAKIAKKNKALPYINKRNGLAVPFVNSQSAAIH